MFWAFENSSYRQHKAVRALKVNSDRRGYRKIIFKNKRFRIVVGFPYEAFPFLGHY